MSKKTMEGVIVSDKMSKTRVVAVVRPKKHPVYKKYYNFRKKFKAHDEKDEYKTGDKVIIEESKPLSKEKRWRIIGKI